MDKYDVIGLLGEGSFGRVYKAKQHSDGNFVALKVISKRGRSAKELKGLRKECEIQRYLHHPNIIQMLDSFETENEIVVITEFAQRELNYILGKEGYLSEERVQAIVWDLISALYYLHSHRVLHRDLKPQNILLDGNSVAKLCDFGFARNMSTGTHVLTSIKGTPLYMAPELIEEQPYDHNADLWSLGCIIYELLVGAPPFCTSSILNLIRLIRHEQIKWPTWISENCISFLKGLLQKNPEKRLTWPEILNHPFVKGHILITEDTPTMPLTRTLSENTLQRKEQQRNELKSGSKKPESNNSRTSQNSRTSTIKLVEEEETASTEKKKSVEMQAKARCDIKLDFHEDSQPIESEEWVVFLQKTIEEIMNKEVGCLLQSGSTNILVNPLRNVNASPRVLGFVANLFALPLIVDIDVEQLEQIKKVYLEVKLVPNLVYATKLLTTRFSSSSRSSSLSTRKSPEDLTYEDLHALEQIFLLICHLVYLDNQFLVQFSDSLAVLNVSTLFQQFLSLVKRKVKIVTDLISILTQVLRKSPENHEVVARVVMDLDFVSLLRNNDALLRERTCYLLLFLGKSCMKIVKGFWTISCRETLEALMYDSIENVRNAAELAVEELKDCDFYKSSDNTEKE